jgi:hypothetical protein
MKKITIVFLLPFIVLSIANAQDVIIRRSGEEIKSKVKAITDKEIEYSKFENLDGPVYKISKSDVLLIMYPNGTKDVFANNAPITTTATANPTVVNRPSQRYFSADFFIKTTPVTYLGVDFSKCKLIGEGFENPKGMFNDINALIEKEKAKYDINGAIRKPNPRYMYSIVDKRNNDVAENSLTENPNDLVAYSQLQNIIDEYDLTSSAVTDGLGLVIIADNLNKTRPQGSFYYVVFDVASKKILISDRFTGRPGGNGLRNYWAKSIHETIMALRDKKYGVWKAMYKR